MYRGATKLNLDDKGRLVIPTRYRVFTDVASGPVGSSAD
jgi:DNA-binding transcriptional regulator/RsmH inhibitor MraZ